MASKLNMNDLVHAAVRRDLNRMEAALRAFPDGDVKRAQDLNRAWAALWNQLHHHHTGEDTYIWPYVRGLGADVLDPVLLDSMEAEHEAMAESMEAATGAIEALTADPSATRAAAAVEAVAHAHAVTDQHLVHEETEVVPAIMAREHTPEWKAVEKNLRKGGAKQGGEMFAWLQDGATPEVKQALTAMVPPPVLFILSRVFGRAYHREVAPVWR